MGNTTEKEKAKQNKTANTNNKQSIIKAYNQNIYPYNAQYTPFAIPSMNNITNMNQNKFVGSVDESKLHENHIHVVYEHGHFLIDLKEVEKESFGIVNNISNNNSIKAKIVSFDDDNDSKQIQKENSKPKSDENVIIQSYHSRKTMREIEELPNPNSQGLGNDNPNDPNIDVKIDDELLSLSEYNIKNPLVVILGIGEYNNLPNLDGVKEDYKNIISTFKNNNNFNYTTHYEITDKNDSRSYKLEWTLKEIDLFLIETQKLLLTNNHDGLIFCISCHGEVNEQNLDCILDSDSNQKTIDSIFGSFSGNSYQYLRNLPKIFFIDCCRGETSASSQSSYDHKQYKKQNMREKGNRFAISKSHEKGKFYKIFATTKGYASIDTDNGGYLMRNISKIFNNINKLKIEPTLDNIIKLIQKNIKNDSTSSVKTQIAEVLSTGYDNVYFYKNDTDNNNDNNDEKNNENNSDNNKSNNNHKSIITDEFDNTVHDLSMEWMCSVCCGYNVNTTDDCEYGACPGTKPKPPPKPILSNEAPQNDNE